MTKTLKAIHAKTANCQPQYMLADTVLSIGDILEFPYYVHDRVCTPTGYLSALTPARREVPGRFLVSDLLVCTLTEDPRVFVELTALDPHFRMLYPVERVMLLEEHDLLSRLYQPITN